MLLTRRHRLTVVLPIVAALFAAGCGGSDDNSTDTGGSGGGDYLATAKTTTEQNYKGTNTMPDGTSRKPTAGKKVTVLSAGQASPSAQIPSDAAVEAAKAAGWDVTLLDQKLNPANATTLINQAIGAGTEGIILDATDCPLAKQALEAAKAKKIKIVPIYSFDCNDPIFGSSGGDALFSAFINFGKKAPDIGTFTKEYGADQAAAIIAASEGKAQVILFNDPEFAVLKYTAQGFKDEMAKCGGCKILEEVEFKAAELGPALQAKAASALLKNPTATAVKIPYTASALLGIAPAIAASSRKDQLYVMGGEGFSPELDLIRGGKGVSAVNIISSDWVGWAAVDTMNSLFLGQEPADSGIGWTLADKDHNIPASGAFSPPVDFKAAYKKAWGVS